MRILVQGASIVVVAGLMVGCGMMGAKSDSSATPAVSGSAGINTAVLPSNGAYVLKVTLPPDTKADAKDGSLKISAPHYEVEVWLVEGAHSVDDAMGSVPNQITSEFKDFKPEQTSDLTVAGAPAKRLVGHGHEADDGDNGDADAIVFKVNGHVFVALTHDEHLDDAARQGLLALVQTAQVP